MASSEFFKEAFDRLATDGCIGEPRGEPAYSYLRVSSSAQAEEGRSGLPRQVMHVHEAALEHGFRVPWELVFAEDHTGFEFKNRPELSRLRHEYKSSDRRAKAIVMEDIDRLSRNADWHQGFLLDEMKEYGLEVIFWKSYSSRIERAVMGAVSQEGMEKAKQRMREGNVEKAKSGRVTARTRAYGYMFVDSDGNPTPKARKDTHYAPHPEEAEVIKLIYTKVGVEGVSMRQLSTYLEERFSPPKKSAHWYPKQLSLFIRNPVYKGEFVARRFKQVKVPKETDNPHEPVKIVTRKIERPRDEWIIVPVPPIVSEELWDMANKALDKNAKMAPRNAKSKYLLTGLLKCASCGHSYTGSRKKWERKDGGVSVSRHYRCSGQHYVPAHMAKEIGCTQSQIKAEVVEDAVWESICKVLFEPNILIEAIEEEYEGGANQQLNKEIELLERQLQDKDREDEKLYQAYLADVFGADEFAEKRKELKHSRQEIEEELRRLKKRVVSEEEFEERKALVRSLIENAIEIGAAPDAPFDLKQQIIKLMIDEITLNVDEGWVQIEGILRGEYPLDSSIARTSMDTDS